MRFKDILPESEVFAAEGQVGIGGVRRINADSLLIHIENYGEFTLSRDHIKAAHDGKVILDVEKLPVDVQKAIKRAHDGEAG